MPKIDHGWVTPRNMEDYYVYALYDTGGIPFYIGKGRGYRVNNHLKPSSRQEFSHKSHKINKLLKERTYIRREILSYFSNENDAYEMEEWLISYYGLVSEGGCLTNIAKNRNDTTYKTTKASNLKRSKTSSKLDEDAAKKLIAMYSENRYSQKELATIFNISETAVSSLLCGHTLAFSHLENPYKSKGKPNRLKNIYNEVITDRENGMKVRDILNKYDISKTHYYRIVNGKFTIDNTA